MTTDCIPAALLQSFLAGDLAPERETGICTHLEECPACQQLADELSGDEETRQARHYVRNRQPAPELDGALAEVGSRLYALARLNDYREKEPTSAIDEFSTLSEYRVTGAAPIVGRTRLGKFAIVRQIGLGGFAVVYLARDVELDREVALKLPRANELTDPGLRTRFVREAKALARLKHPHIVPVFEAGEHEGTCYLAVGYCNGPTLDQWIRQHAPVEPRLSAGIALDLALAVEHAHQSGILHRDIKPGNVLLDGRPEAAAEDAFPYIPRLTDFGLARLSEEQVAPTTFSGMVMGTPQYMPPEQATGHLERIGPPTDVYSLGAVLYELLTGQPPIKGSTPVDTLRRVLIDEPLPPHRVVGEVPEDLSAIVMKCLEKSAPKRYPTAAALADDLERFLAGRPTVARPLGMAQRTWRHVRNNPAGTALATLTALVLALVVGLYAYQRRLEGARKAMAQAVEKSSQLQKQVQSSDIQLEQLAYADGVSAAADAVFQGDLSKGAALLQKLVPAAGKPDYRGLEWHYLWALATHEALAEADAGTEVYQLALSADGVQLAAAGKDGTVRLYDPATLTLRDTIAAGQGEINGVAFNWNGQALATAGDDGTVKTWRLADLSNQARMEALPGFAYGVRFHDRSTSLLAYGRESAIRVLQLNGPVPDKQLVWGHEESVEAMAVSPDGTRLATVGSDKFCIVWDAKTLKPLQKFGGHHRRLSSVAFSPDGKWLATGSLDFRAILWNVEDGRFLCEATHLDEVQALTFSRDGQRLISGDRAGMIRSWQIEIPDDAPGSLRLTLNTAEDRWQAHRGRVWSLVALPDGERFLSSGADGLIRCWGRGDQRRVERTIKPVQLGRTWHLDFAANGSLYACGATGVGAYDPATGKLRFRLPSKLKDFDSLAVLEDEGLVAAGNENGQVQIWDFSSRKLLHELDVGRGNCVQDLVYSPTADLLLALVHARDAVYVIEPRSGRIVKELRVESHNDAAFSPDGKHVAIDSQNRIAIYSVPSFKLEKLFPAHASTIKDLAYSPDGQMLASVSNDRKLKLWTSTGEPLATLGSHRGPVMQVAFTPDGKSLVTGDEGGGIRITHVATRCELMDLPNPSKMVQALTISPDSRLLGILNFNYEIDIIGPPAGSPAKLGGSK